MDTRRSHFPANSHHSHSQPPLPQPQLQSHPIDSHLYSSQPPPPQQQQQQQQQQHSLPPSTSASHHHHHHQHQQQPQPHYPPPQHQSTYHPPHPPPPAQQQPPQQQTSAPPQHHQLHHHAHPHPPPSTHSSHSASVPPPPTPQTSQQHSQPQQPQHHIHTTYSSPQSAPATSGPALPPIQQGYPPQPPSAGPSDPQNLPPFRHPQHASAPPPSQHSQHPPSSVHEAREPSDYPSTTYSGPTRGGHDAPVSGVNRTYSHDSASQPHPTTPVQASQYPPPTHNGGPPPPPPPSHHPSSMEHGALHAYPPTNGVMHGPPPQHPSAPQGPHSMPPPHHDPYMNPVMDNPHSYPGSQHMYPYGPASAMFSGAPSKRKQMRASQACEQCRQRKQKCDEGQPCSFCKESSLPCVYRDAAPPKTDKNLEKLMSFMEANSATLQQLLTKMNDFDTRLQRMETATKGAPASTTTDKPRVGSRGSLEGESPGSSGEPQTDEQQSAKRRNNLDDHRTAPHKLLLLWPSIKPMLDAADVQVKDSYVMEAEDRGVLRLHTRGEGIDEFDGTQPGGPASPARSEESTEVNTPSPPEGVWGTGFPMTPGGSDQGRRPDVISPGGMKADNTLDLDVATINSLYESFMKHIHIMHPFVDRYRLRRMFDSFIHNYATGRKVPTFVVSQNGNDFERPSKRQRSSGPTSYHSSGSGSEYVIKATERSPTNAIVYLVMALGKICLFQDLVPGPLPESKMNANILVAHQASGTRGSIASSSPVSAKIKPSPTSPPINITPGGPGHPTPPPMESSQSRSRRPSFDSAGSPWSRNLDAIPGMAYFTKAVEILGDQADGTDLVHAQMFLLAGLYKGALARVKESMSWFSLAGRALRILLDRYKLFNEEYWNARGDVRKRLQQGQKQIKDKRTNLIVLASWTCLQLETDILAELPLPSSGIHDLEGMLLLPHKVTEDEESNGLDPDGAQEDYDRIMYYYTAQFWLRKRLNLIHRELYGVEALSLPLNQVQEMLRSHESILAGWRDILDPTVRWEDGNAPATNILDARLRAKYWGARYVVNRPFLDYALHIMPFIKQGHELEEVARDAYNNPRGKAEIHLFEAIKGMPEAEIWQASRRCIEAAMQSTVAFDGIPGRLIVTNIHGTAHAQFGNMLVLSATYNSKVLNALVPKDSFQKLLGRTIQFLRRIPNSATCRIDCGILESLHRFLFGIPANYKHYYQNEGVEYLKGNNSAQLSHNSSFSSNMG